MDEQKQQSITEFCSITGADTDRAEFFLQAAGWDTNLAVSTFFENSAEDVAIPEELDVVPATTQPRMPAPNPEPQPPQQRVAPRPQPQRTGIQTFASMGANQPQQEEGEEGQAHYAGGSVNSGQQIVDPSRRKKKDHVAEELFRAAREHGAEAVSESGRPGARAGPSHFVGTGYRLGESEAETSQSVAGASTPKVAMTVVLKLWKTGFTINDEQLRPFDDPQNRQFLQSIQKGEIPQELVSKAEGGEVALDMEDHRDEDYMPPKQPKIKAFAGSGQTLGAQASTSAAVDSSSAVEVTVDPSQPITSIQIRLADGSRLVAKFNHSHTVGDLRRHIVASRPQYAGVAFSLCATLPSRTLSDDSTTLKDADVLNAAIMQRL